MADINMSSAGVGSTSAAANATGSTVQLPINLFTRSTNDAIPQSTYLIPASWRRFQLSELINKVLQNNSDNGKKPVPFEFLINGEVLRGSLESWSKKNRGNDEETTIDIEYVRSTLPPQEVGRVEVEDWVSGLSLSRKGYILLSSYLSHLQILPLSSASTSSALYTLSLPTSLGATSCTWVSPPSQNNDILLAAGGVDRLTHVYTIPSLSPDTAQSSPPRELYTLHGHTQPVSTVIASESGKEIVSGSWDGLLNLYALPSTEPDEHQVAAEPLNYLPGQGNKKRRKMEKENPREPIEGLLDNDSTGEGGWRRVPDITFKGHTGRIGGAVWDKADQGKIWSAGWDGSVRGWDLNSGINSVVRQGPFDKSGLCIDQFAANGTLATGNMDRTICLWDTRQATSMISLTLQTTSPIPSIKTHPTSSFTLASATYAGTVQIWDIRSPKNSLFSVSNANRKERKVTKNGKVLGERLLALDWDGEVLVAGGEDGEVGIWNAAGA
ncbi:ribosome biogenesis protein YTM1 [Kwoniella dejecticola CBS 10117]|uniref:Ribosome biogenesis protein YTM1 n=1 Tax=Kwoniella dejecticola CBS 10117 TaxID=1296121 RepID=A0A1A6AC91_9TREE|nr:ribosome biogenesis protein YTM1 [Kwoniella dejecticola CBS 10117]OBR87674.1 ribosome biogenesis protein YTM1 [Kwoniella dejecticola CBS 10117]